MFATIYDVVNGGTPAQQKMYERIVVDSDYGVRVQLILNPLHFCVNPKVLLGSRAHHLAH